ncbi:hypothetical protein BVRB_8g187000 [Beta vulgaris subsp. vulgaris]|nr:hypothetical protein BVRB_8g187000 [Beta vulgaris subsp. vulgaris]
MRQSNLMILLQIFLLAVALTRTSQSQEQIDFAGVRCLKSEQISTATTYHGNILTLLSKLHSLSTTSKFSISSSGLGPDRVNGFYHCRPDLSLSTCEACINHTINSFNRYCFDKTEAIILYEECMILYTNKSTSPENNENMPWYFNYFTYNVSRPQIFPALLKTTMQSLIVEAVSATNNSQRYFAIGDADFTAFERLYVMVLCRPDMTPEDCEGCLRIALDRIPTCCGGLASWTMVFLPNCQLRYDTAPFIFPPDSAPVRAL